MQLIRYLLGRLILAIDWLTRPKPVVERSAADQQRIAQKLQTYSLFELPACPFCVKVRRECRRLALDIRRLNVKQDADSLQDLKSAGGKYQVPCLRIEKPDGSTEWLYESSDIISRLREDFLSPS
ncbi:MAG: glutathione S-transferase N-terminal domain-containing protein [Gammaproteobacteria bacterium]|nr:glutathione S-transferase N-terminal domain-containing protein [Gammaproteobacteria bacterium]